jgi:nitrate reductase NapE component
MALGKAVGIGMVAALALPAIFKGGSGAVAEWVRGSTLRLELADFAVNFSWPIFAVVALFAWGFLAWSNR